MSCFLCTFWAERQQPVNKLYPKTMHRKTRLSSVLLSDQRIRPKKQTNKKKANASLNLSDVQSWSVVLCSNKQIWSHTSKMELLHRSLTGGRLASRPFRLHRVVRQPLDGDWRWCNRTNDSFKTFQIKTWEFFFSRHLNFAWSFLSLL